MTYVDCCETETVETEVGCGYEIKHVASSSSDEDNRSDALCLSLDWNDVDIDETTGRGTARILSSYSDGTLAVHAVSSASNAGDLPKISLEHEWTAHTLFGATPAEVWTCCWNRHDPSSSLLLSGADNGTLKSWDLRSASAFGTNKRKPVWFVGEEELAAGVTMLSWHPTEENVFAVESYDDSVRV